MLYGRIVVYSRFIMKPVLQSFSKSYVANAFATSMSQQGFDHSYDHNPIPKIDSTLLFKISGGVNYNSNIIRDIKLPPFSNNQICIRGEKKVKKVGYSGKHHFSFEMLGHFDIGNHNSFECREVMILPAINFLTKELNLPAQILEVTLHPEDEESISIVSKLGIKYNFNNNNVNNFPAGRCFGYRVEINFTSPVNNTTVELWNIVFTDFDIIDNVKIKRTYSSGDSGTSCDRITSAVEGKTNDYDNSNWLNILNQYFPNQKDVSTEKIRLVEYLKLIELLVKSNLVPGPKKREYYLRRSIRNSLELAVFLNIPFEFFPIFKYPVIVTEINQYKKTFHDGVRRYEELKSKKKDLSNQDLQFLWQTHGFKPEFIGGSLL